MRIYCTLDDGVDVLATGGGLEMFGWEVVGYDLRLGVIVIEGDELAAGELEEYDGIRYVRDSEGDYIT